MSELLTQKKDYKISVIESEPQVINNTECFYTPDTEMARIRRKSVSTKCNTVSFLKLCEGSSDVKFHEIERKMTENIKNRVDFDKINEDIELLKFLK